MVFNENQLFFINYFMFILKFAYLIQILSVWSSSSALSQLLCPSHNQFSGIVEFHSFNLVIF
jgi:hypothetical protein